MDINYVKKYEPIDGKWYVLREIGSGSYGTVFEIYRKDIDIRSALKVISVPAKQSEYLSKKKEYHMDDDSLSAYFYGFVEEYTKEIELMTKLKGNSNIVSIEDYDIKPKFEEFGWDIFIRMELLSSLDDYFGMYKPSEKTVVKLGIDICKALEICKTLKIIHRDIKPSNVFVSSSGDFKLGDFGVARTIENISGSLSKKGSYSYMAPEVYRGQSKYTSDIDMYSLGILLYKLLNYNLGPFCTGLTYEEEMNALYKRMKGEEKLPEPANANSKLAVVILKACSFSSENRFSDPSKMREALERVLPHCSDKLLPQTPFSSTGMIEDAPEPAPAPVPAPVPVPVPAPAPEPKSKTKSKFKSGGGKKPFKIKKIFAGINNRKVLLFAIIFILTLVVLGSVVIGGLVLSGKIGKIDFSLNDILNRNKIEQYLDKNELGEAWQFFESLPEDEKKTELYYELCYAYGKKYYEEKNYSSAKNALRSIGNDYVRFEEVQELLWDAEVEYARQLYNKKDYHRVITSLEIIPTSYKNYDKVEELLNEAKYSYIKENETRNDRTFKYLNDLKAIKYKDTQQIYDKLCEWDAEVFFNEDFDDTTTKASSMKEHDFCIFHVVVTGGPPNEEIELYASIYYPDGTSSENSFYSSFSDGGHGYGYISTYRGKGTYKVKIYDINNNFLAENSLKIY